MASPTAKLKGSKTRLCLIRFVGDAAAFILAQHQRPQFLFFNNHIIG